MFAAPFFEGLVQLAHQPALVLTQLYGRFNGDVAIQVTRIAGAHTLDADHRLHAQKHRVF